MLKAVPRYLNGLPPVSTASTSAPGLALSQPQAGAVHGLLFAGLAYLLYATSDAVVKLLASRYPVAEIMVFHAGFAMIAVIGVLLREGGLSGLRPRRPLLVALRGLLAGLGTVLVYHAFQQLPLAEVYAICFCTPILVTVLSVPLLGEKVGLHRWGAAVAGFVGILVMLRPGAVEPSLGHLLAFGGAASGAGVIIILRKIGGRERPGTLVLSVLGGLLAVSVPTVAVDYRPMAWADLGLIAGAAGIMAVGQFAIIRALRLAPAALIAPVQYTMMPWAILFGLLLFGNPVHPLVLLGAAIVIGSSVYTLHRERYRGRSLQAHVPTGFARAGVAPSAAPAE
jgi:drug/metabolite transporter (DMT)-like permease